MTSVGSVITDVTICIKNNKNLKCDYNQCATRYPVLVFDSVNPVTFFSSVRFRPNTDRNWLDPEKKLIFVDNL